MSGIKLWKTVVITWVLLRVKTRQLNSNMLICSSLLMSPLSAS